MSDLRSRAAVFGLTTGAAVLLAVPVVASGQVPGVDRVVGGVNRAAQDVVQGAPPVPVLPIQLPARPPAPSAAPAAGGSHSAPETSAPAAPAPAPAASAPAGSAQSGSASAPAAAARAAAPATGSGSGGGSSGVSASASGAKRRGTSASSSHKARAAQDSGSGPTDVEIADEAAEAPRDASPATLPFTGLRLALMLTAGLAVLATGTALRWTVR
jgi:hypothetical protein